MLEKSDLKVYNAVVEQKELLAENYEIMQLYCNSASPISMRVIKETINNYPLGLNKTEMIKMMVQDGFAEISFDELFAHMRSIKRVNNEL